MRTFAGIGIRPAIRLGRVVEGQPSLRLRPGNDRDRDADRVSFPEAGAEVGVHVLAGADRGHDLRRTLRHRQPVDALIPGIRGREDRAGGSAGQRRRSCHGDRDGQAREHESEDAQASSVAHSRLSMPYLEAMSACPRCGAENVATARFCNSCGYGLERPAGVAMHVRKTVTVLFCDVTGSTALGERQDPGTSPPRDDAATSRSRRRTLERHRARSRSSSATP